MSTLISKGPTVSPSPAASPFAGNRPFAQRSILLGSAAGLAIFSAAALVAMLRQAGWEFPLVTGLNSLAGRSAALDRLIQSLTVDQLLQGVSFIAVLWYLWFATDDIDERATLLSGLAAAACAGFVSRGLQLALPTHPRPLHTAALGFVIPPGVEPTTLNHFNSFPSDHGAVFFALAIVICRMKPWLGAGTFIWAAIVDAARVYEGYHWPSDIVGAFGLSLLVVSGLQSQAVHRLARRLVALEAASRAWFYLAAFVVTYQVATLFDDIRQIGRGVALVVLHHVPFGGT